MPEDLVIARLTVNNAVLDQVVSAASASQGLVRQLTRVTDGLKQRLLSADRETARLAASELMSTYFRVKVR